MDEAERDRTRQAEDIPAAELGELLGHEAAVQERRELRAEARVDDREQEAPDGKRKGHEREPDALEPPRLTEERPVHDVHHGAASS